MTQHSLIDDRIARRNLVVLIALQAVLGSQITMTFVIGGLAGQMLAPHPCLATLPISLVVLGAMTTAPWLSPFMARHGRVPGFVLGAVGGICGSALAAIGLWSGSFALLLAGSYLTGTYMSAQGFFRFAATDRASAQFRPKAISWTMAGGLLAALIGPQLVKLTEGASAVPFLASYLTATALSLAGIFLFLFLDLPRAPQAPAGAPAPRAPKSWRALLASPSIGVAVLVGAVSYALMNLVMTSTPLAVVGCGFSQGQASDIVSAHVIAMYLPSLVTGHLILRFGPQKVMATGLAILGLAGLVALSGVGLGQFFAALILLGAGWNFGFIGATALLTAAHAPEDRARVQGMNDAIVFGAVTLASLASGGLMNCSGGSPVEGWSAVNLAMVPFLILAGSALIWLKMRVKS